MKRLLCALAALSFITATVFSVSGCVFYASKYQKQYIGAFDTLTVISGYAKSKSEFDSVADELFERLTEYHRLFDIYNEYEGINNLKTVNDNAGVASVEVKNEIIELLLLAKNMYALTDGAVNVAMGSVLELWHEYRQNGLTEPENAELPPEDKLATAAEHTDIRNIVIDEENCTVYITDKELSIDVGAVAKGYAVERVCEYAVSEGIESMTVNVGGNVRTIGAKADGSDWIVGIASPYNTDDVLCTVSLKDLSVVTSGAYQRYYEVDGKRLHHIIDPTTLMPSERYISVTVICEDSAVADALSTALFNMEQDDGKALIESMEATEALWVCADGSLLYSSGFCAMSDIGA